MISSVQFSPVPQSCLTVCNPMDCSMPGFPVQHQLAQTHVHQVGDAIQIISSSVVPFSSCLQSFPVSGSYPMNQFFASGGQSVGVLASMLVLPMNIQDWFPLGWTGWICLLSKGLSRVFSSTTVQKHGFFSTQFSFLFFFYFLFFIIFFNYYFFYCSGFCHILKWSSHGFTCVPHPNAPSHLPLHLIPLGLPSAPGPSACLMYPTWAGDLFHPR